MLRVRLEGSAVKKPIATCGVMLGESLACVAMGCSNSGGDGASGGTGGSVGAGEPTGLTGITQLHNDARATEGVPPLTWDPALAAIAQAWADACVDKEAPTALIDHDAGRSDNYPGYVGDNF